MSIGQVVQHAVVLSLVRLQQGELITALQGACRCVLGFERAQPRERGELEREAVVRFKLVLCQGAHVVVDLAQGVPARPDLSMGQIPKREVESVREFEGWRQGHQRTQ